MLRRKTPLKRGGFLKRTRLSPVSKKRAKDMRTYAKLRKGFLEAHPRCQVWLSENEHRLKTAAGWSIAYILDALGCPLATDIHHTAGRTGTNYLDTSTWMAVSRSGHEKIHSNPSWARRMGFLK